MHRIIAASLLPLFLAAPALAAPALPGTPLQWRFKDGQTFYIEETSDADQELNVGGNAINMKQVTRWVWRVKVLRVAENGDVQLERRIESVSGSVGDNDLKDQYKALTGLTFKLTLGKDMRVLKFEGYDAFAKLDDPFVQQVGAYMNEDYFKNLCAEPFQLLPGRTVEKGEKWKQSSKSGAFLMALMKIDREMVHEGPIRINGQEFEKIGFTAKIALQLPEMKDEKIPIKIEKLESSGGDSTGSLLFDTQAQRMVQMETSVKDLKLAMSVDIGGMKQDINIKMNQTITWKLLEELPKAK